MPASDSYMPVRGRGPLGRGGPNPFVGTAEDDSAEFFEAPLADGQTALIKCSAMRALRETPLGTSVDVLGFIFGTYTPRGPCIERFEPLFLLPDELLPGEDDVWLAEALAPFDDMPAPLGLFRIQVEPGGPTPRPRPKGLRTQDGFFAPGQMVRVRAGDRPLGARRQPVHSSTQGSELELSRSDHDLVRRCLPRLLDLRALFLVIQNVTNQPWSAALFVLDADRVTAQRAPGLVFPFDETIRNGLRDGQHWLQNTSPNDPRLRIDSEARRIPPVVRHDAPGITIRQNLLLLSVAVLITLIGGGMAAYWWLYPARAVSSAQADGSKSDSIALKVDRNGGDFEVSWNRNSKAVRDASEGTLTIHDGTITRTVQLDGPRLREGKILYSALFSELSFRLEVNAGGRTTATESVRVLSWKLTPGIEDAKTGAAVSQPGAGIRQ